MYVAEGAYPIELLLGRPSLWLAVWMLSVSRTTQLRFWLFLAKVREMRVARSRNSNLGVILKIRQDTKVRWFVWKTGLLLRCGDVKPKSEMGKLSSFSPAKLPTFYTAFLHYPTR
jgi:hypothetical protein